MAGGGSGQRLVGRARPLRELEAALREAVAGRGALALVTGEAGIGKSRLAAELAARAPTLGARVVWASCWDGGGAPAYWPWVQALRAAAAGRDPVELAADLGLGAGEVLRLAPYEAYGPDLRDCTSLLNRPMFLHQLAGEWLPALPELHARLQADPSAQVADVGCGTGWSSIAIALAYPRAVVHGLDLDEDSIAEARRNAAQAGVADRITFEVRDAADPGLAGRYDLVCAFETIHDMADPVAALRAMRALRAKDGVVLVGDEKVAESFTASGDELERLNYGWSALHCLPSGMVRSRRPRPAR